METLIYLILNSALVIFLINSCYKLFLYDMKWWLRVQRSTNLLKNHFGSKRVLLEIKVPREVTKSPAAMELFLGSISSQNLGHSVDPLFAKADKETKISGKGLAIWKLRLQNSTKWWFEFRKYWLDKYIKGGMRGWYSLEMISEEGKIRFFLYTYEKNVDGQRNVLQSQYPGIEVVEAEDYTLNHHYKPGGDLDVYFGKWKLKKPDYLPIKTYVDYGLDKDPKDEFKVDPMQSLLETMSTAGKGEHFWFQIMLRTTIKENWKDDGRKKIDEILGITRYKKDDTEVKEGKAKENEIKFQKNQVIGLAPEQKKEIEIISKNVEKDGLDCFVRMLSLKYKKDGKGLVVPKNILPVVYAMKPFDSVGYNAFGFDTITTDTDYPTLDPNSAMSNNKRSVSWENYVLRTGFYFEAEALPYKPWVLWKIYKTRLKAIPSKIWGKEFYGFIMHEYYGVPEIHAGGQSEFVLNTEEVATIFHIPYMTSAISNSVVSSTKSDPPINLPV